MILEFCRQIFEKSSDMKLNDNPSSVSQVAPYGGTGVMKLVVCSRNCANAPENAIQYEL